MSVAEIKVHLINQITTIENEDLLEKVLELINESIEDQNDIIDLSSTYNEVKTQYGDVLQKLAE